MTKEELALNYYNHSCNCCQSVVCAFADEIGLDEETLKRMAAGFGVGMGSMEGPCGALSGAVMAAGLMQKGGNPLKLSKKLLSGFQDTCGAVICKEIKGVETGNILCSCPECITNAIRLLQQTMTPDNPS